MGSDGLQVVPGELVAAAGQWQALGSQLTVTTPPSPGPSFQPTTAAVSGVNAAIVAAAAAFATRTQETATGMTTASATYGKQETTNGTDMANVTGVTVV
ncbi:hypothetical protein A5675_21635 [Mycobacterium malmoense]|uniref:hypothetical protein n=1 Tax=Mycobacterium malmoense TaxID=1780 RepID=UPI00080B3D64|nr:hypothetical protein [Mycobacterium malmoense]OCB33698.1 hypothetical protein A5675_21635 [Mycobacterium malmoense]